MKGDTALPSSAPLSAYSSGRPRFFGPRVRQLTRSELSLRRRLGEASSRGSLVRSRKKVKR